MKSGQILVSCMTNISDIFLAQCWRLETRSRPFYDFIKITILRDLVIFNSWHLPFLIVPYSPFQKHETLEFWHKSLVSSWSRLLNWKKTWNLASVLQIVQKIPENYCPCFYLSIGQVWLFHELWLKRYVQKCDLSRVLISSWRHRFGQSWDVKKYTNLHILRTEHKFSMK